MIYLTSYQEQGARFTLDEANADLNAARNRTPRLNWEQFRSKVRFDRMTGMYEWEWVLR